MILLHNDGVEGRVLTPSYENTAWKTSDQKKKAKTTPKQLKLTKKDTLQSRTKKPQWYDRKGTFMIQSNLSTYELENNYIADVFPE